jgi:hypothetical protein
MKKKQKFDHLYWVGIAVVVVSIAAVVLIIATGM